MSDISHPRARDFEEILRNKPLNGVAFFWFPRSMLKGQPNVPKEAFGVQCAIRVSNSAYQELPPADGQSEVAMTYRAECAITKNVAVVPILMRFSPGPSTIFSLWLDFSQPATRRLMRNLDKQQLLPVWFVGDGGDMKTFTIDENPLKGAFTAMLKTLDELPAWSLQDFKEAIQNYLGQFFGRDVSPRELLAMIEGGGDQEALQRVWDFFEKNMNRAPSDPFHPPEPLVVEEHEQDNDGELDYESFGGDYPTLVREVADLACKEAERRGFRLVTLVVRDVVTDVSYHLLNAQAMGNDNSVQLTRPADPVTESRAVAEMVLRESKERGLTATLLSLDGDSLYSYGERHTVEDWLAAVELMAGSPMVKVDVNQLYPWPGMSGEQGK
jgi:hypothetical protein